MKFGLRFALLAQTKCQNMAPRLSRVTRLSTSSPSYDYASEDCTVVFDADGVALRGREHSTCAPSTRPRESLRSRTECPSWDDGCVARSSFHCSKS